VSIGILAYAQCAPRILGDVMLRSEEVDAFLDRVAWDQVFEVHFIKSDNTVRVMRCQLSNKPKVTRLHKNLVNVYDVDKQAFRSFNKTHVLEIHANVPPV
jgi:hypothetical protein